MKNCFDIIVVGGGIVGAMAACILARENINVALLDAKRPERDWPDGSINNRVSALTLASQNMLQAVDVWPDMVKRGVSPYTQMRIWDAAAQGELHFDNGHTAFNQLGHIVQNRVIVAALWEKLDSLSSATCIFPAKVTALQKSSNGRRLILDDGRQLDAQLVIAADGGASLLRSLAGITVTGRPYRQQGLIATVTTEKSHQATAWQRFLPEGPLAFLPLHNGQCSIVWSLATETANQYLQLPEAEFLQKLQVASAGILGQMLAVSDRAVFPLHFQYADSYIADSIALIGDAAHTMHPLAGQGANAGLLDAAAISQLIVEARQQGRPISSHRILRKYERWRKGDNQALLWSLDGLNKIFRDSRQPLVQLRSTGMNLINGSGFLKNYINFYAMGIRDDLPKLAKCLNLNE